MCFKQLTPRFFLAWDENVGRTASLPVKVNPCRESDGGLLFRSCSSPIWLMGFIENGGAVNFNPERIADCLGGCVELKSGTVKAGLLPLPALGTVGNEEDDE